VGRQRRKLYKPPPPSSSFPFHQNFLLNDVAASSTDLARISAYMNRLHRSSPALSDDPRKRVLSNPFIRSPSPEQIPFALNPSAVTVVPCPPPVPHCYPATLDGYIGYGYGTDNALYDSYMRTAVDPIHVPDPSLSCPNSHSSAESSTMARSPTNLHSRSKKSISRSASTSHIIRRWSMLHVPDEILALELEQLRRITRIKQRRKSDKAKSSFTHWVTLEQPSASPFRDQVRFPTKEDYFIHDPTHADATLSGAFVYGGPGLRQKFWLADDDDDDEGRSDEDDISDVSDDDSDTPEDDLQTPPDIEDHQERAWKVARKALFCCRELVRTEKTYFSKLVQLKDGQVIVFSHHFYLICLTSRFRAKTLTPPPSLLTSYLPALILASNTLLEHCSQDPTVYGISTAFLESSAQLEHALVAYCGIVGDIFSTKRTHKRKLVRGSSGVADELKRASPPNDASVSRSLSRKSLNHTSSPQLSLFGFSDKRKTIPLSRSTLDVSRPFPIVEAPPPPVPPLPTENESPPDPKAIPRRSFSLFRRKTSSQASSPTPATQKSAKSSWRRFRSSSKTSDQGLTDSNDVIEFQPQQIHQVPPRPTRPVPPVPRQTLPASELGELNNSTHPLRRHGRSASLQDRYAFPANPPPSSWIAPNSMRRGGMSLDMNHIVRSAETSTRSSHDLSFGTGERRERTPTVRDLAILPTQRVMRYVLLFKGSYTFFISVHPMYAYPASLFIV